MKNTKPKGIDWNDSLAGFKSALAGVANFVKQDLESQSATFVNPWINLAGKAVGKNPNLREAKPMEAALNTAMAVATIVTGGMAKSASTAIRAAKGTSQAVGASQAATNALDRLAKNRMAYESIQRLKQAKADKWFGYGQHPAASRARAKLKDEIYNLRLGQSGITDAINKEAKRIDWLTRGKLFGD